MSDVILKQFSLHDEITNKDLVIKQANAETLQTFKDSEQSINCVECADTQILFKQLGI